MQPLFERLINRQFSDSISAIAYCRELCAEFGFTVKQEASANRNIYVYCSREGLPDSQRNPKPAPQRKRPSKRCDCRWRVVLSENEQSAWVFRRSMNPNASEHNHEMMSPDEMEKPWPAGVTELINRLAGEIEETNKIRERVRQEFPLITWNERRFYNRLTEARKRIKYMTAVKNARTLLPLSSRLCSIVAHNKTWVDAVANDLQRMLDQYLQLANITTDSLDSLCDLQSNTIEPERTNGFLGLSPPESSNELVMDTQDEDEEDNGLPNSPSKKRKSSASTQSSLSNNNRMLIARKVSMKNKGTESQKGIHRIHIPSYTIQVPIPSKTITNSTHKKRVSECESPFIEEAQHSMHSIQQQSTTAGNNHASFFSFTSPTSSASSSSSVPLQRYPMSAPPHLSRRMSPPPPQQPSTHDFVMSSHYHSPQGNNTAYNMQASSFTPYTISHSATTAFSTPTSELPYGSFETNRSDNSSIMQSRQQDDPRLMAHHSYYVTVKEEPNQDEQHSQHEPILRQDHIQRNNMTDFNHSTQIGYALPPMIRSMEDSKVEEGNHWN
ncbi:MAG: hypothetical protein EXX96DRAFT_594994 [Benjaminiella poitrasii]|nr:MAG: hypothetical protein EXX96DRAFT_594994 [Benjaminiella poitrasii]